MKHGGKALWPAGMNCTRVSMRYGEIFHEPKASEISCHISQLTSVISALFL